MNAIQLSIRCGAIAAALLWASPSLGQSRISDHYEDFLKPKPPLHLTEPQRQRVAAALVTEHTAQRTPEGFVPQLGMKVQKPVQSQPMPPVVFHEIPELREYYYAKLDRNLLVIDPMTSKAVDMIPRKYPSSRDKPYSAATWAQTRGRELIGLPADAPSGTTGSAGVRP